MFRLFVVILIASTDTRRVSDTKDRLSDRGDGIATQVRAQDGNDGLQNPAKGIPKTPESEPMERALRPKFLPDFLKPLIFVYMNDDDDDDGPKPNITQAEKRTQLWFDFPGMHEKNVQLAGTNLKDFNSRWRSSVIAPTPRSLPKTPYFNRKEHPIENEDDRRFIKKRVINWTECDEFGRGANFEPNDIVDLDWLPFYEWSTKAARKSVAFIYRFTKPTMRMAQKYQERFGIALGDSVNWENAKLELTVASTEYLLVATDKWGVLILIPDMKLPESIKGTENAKVPIKKVRVRIFDPYLFLMDCDAEYAVLMALDGQEPATPKKIQEASAIGFQGIGYPVARDAAREANLLPEDLKTDTSSLP